MEIKPYRIAEAAQITVEKMDDQKALKLYGNNEDARLVWANGYVEFFKARNYTEAQAQLYVLDVLQSIYRRVENKSFMATFTEKIREQLVEKLYAFGDKAYPLTTKQFESAVKAAW